jgi:hypothetical protein
MGDTFYLWDLDRSSLSDFMVYVHRVMLHMIGYSSIKLFHAHGMKTKADQLLSGVKMYWGITFAILLITRSPSFVFWIILQPLMCMCYFLALINIGFHGFLEYDEQGKSIELINSTTIIEGEDDVFGEDDHMAHHYNTTVYFKDLADHQKSKESEFKRAKASVFKKLSIVELSIFILLGLWDKVAEHYVDYSGQLSKEQIIDMLRTRARRTEITFSDYERFLENPTPEARKVLLAEASKVGAAEAAAASGAKAQSRATDKRRNSSPTSVTGDSHAKSQ